MLIRVRGGNAGVFKYLRDGKKSGRTYSRDELDERVVLSGNMQLAESVVNAMGGRGEKYLHITLAFREDQLPLETLQAITDEFQRFCMSAFRPDEYSFYAEAHLPRIKSFTNRRSGTDVIRRPHIHIVIPELNLLTTRPLNPLGRVDRQTKFLEAFQEHINAKYGLASPKDNRRIGFTDESTRISRTKGDHFKGIGSELKYRLLFAIIERNVVNFSDFQQLARAFGAVRVRNEDKPNAYLNIRPEGTKGVNLKDYVFSHEFIELPTDEKLGRMRGELERMGAEAAEYVEAKSPRPSPEEITGRLAGWHEIRARELKYINSGSQRRYAEYRAADSAGKRAILDEREAAFYQNYGQDVLEEGVLLGDLELGPIEPFSAPSGVANMPVREPESVVEQLLTEHKKEVVEAALAVSQEHTRIKSELDANLLIARLSHTHGVVPEKYPVTKVIDGGDRIQCGSRRLNVADFLTKELHLPWPEAQTILRETYAAQHAASPAHPRTEIRGDLWQSYQETWPARKAARERAWAAQRVSEASRRAQLKADYLQDRAAIKADLDKSPAERKADYSLASMRKAMLSAKLLERFRLERQALGEKHPQPGSAGYRLYLVELAHDCNASALAELRRQTPPGKPSANGDGFSSQCELDPTIPVILPSVSYRADQRGNVTYYADDAKKLPILIDTGYEVKVLDCEPEFVELGLRLAIQKFGRSLDVRGSDEFKAQVLSVVLRTGLSVEFKDSHLAGELQRLSETEHMTRKTEEEIEAEYAGESDGYGQDAELDDQWPEPTEDSADYEIVDDQPTPGGPRMG